MESGLVSTLFELLANIANSPGYVPENLMRLLPAELHEQIPLILGNIAVATSFEWGSPIRLLINQAYRETIKTLFITCVIFAAIGFLFAFAVEDINMDVLIERSEEALREETERAARQEAELKKQQSEA